MIPRQLRIKKFPSTTYSDAFMIEWNNVLSECSLDLMGLIAAQEEKLLTTINGEIQSLRDSLNVYNTLVFYKSLDSELNDIVNKTEQDIMAIKRQKFLRDLQDYQNGAVYVRNRTERPHSILRNIRRTK